MSRTALVVSDPGGTDQTLEQQLQRHGYSRIVNNTTMTQALVTLEQEAIDLLVVPIEGVDEGQLAVIDRLNRRERQMGAHGRKH
jgi:ActR/RegA family two-component response regulator